jgi:hypothetical protein
MGLGRALCADLWDGGKARERPTLGNAPAVGTREWEEGATNVFTRPGMSGEVDDSWRPGH